MSVSTNDFKNGMTLELDGVLFQIIEFQHVKPGKGGAFVRSKLRNVKTGAVLERLLPPIETVKIEIRQVMLLTQTLSKLRVRPPVLKTTVPIMVNRIETLNAEAPVVGEVPGMSGRRRCCGNHLRPELMERQQV